MRIRSTLLPLALFGGVCLAACQRTPAALEALPLTTDVAPALTNAPGPDMLPPAPPLPVAYVQDPREDYAFADRAWALSDAFADSPPDWSYYDDGVQPWVWIADDGAWELAEPCPGGERYYYFQAGADEPFFVQDPDYGYGYANGALVVVYDHEGRALPSREYADYADVAGRYFTRGETLRRTARSAQHQPVAAANWTARRSYFADRRASWARESAAEPDWQAYHAQHQGEEQAHWAAETARRETWAAQTDARLGHQRLAQHETQLAQAAPHPQRSLLAAAPALPGLPVHAQPTTPAPRFAEGDTRRMPPEAGGAPRQPGHEALGRGVSEHAAIAPPLNEAPGSKPMRPAPHEGPLASAERHAPPSAPAFHAAPATSRAPPSGAMTHEPDRRAFARRETQPARAPSRAFAEPQRVSPRRQPPQMATTARPAFRAPPQVAHAPPPQPPRVAVAQARPQAPPKSAPPSHPQPPQRQAAADQHNKHS